MTYSAALKSLRDRLRARFGETSSNDRLFADPTPPVLPPPAEELELERASIQGRHPGLGERLARLNAWQLAAVLAEDAAVMVRAQVGSGKTTVLVDKILTLHLVRGVPLERIVVLTFTCKAALEIRRRVGKLGCDAVALVAGTFHSVARRLGDYRVIAPTALEALWRQLITEHRLTIRYQNKLSRRMEALALGRPLYGNMRHADDIVRLAELADEACCEAGVLDFDTLLEEAGALLERQPMDPSPEWILIDEFQDCDEAQLRFLERLAGPESRLFAVGDPNQVIYSWRGSAPELFGRFERAHGAAVHRLPVNYRSSGSILACARVFLRQDTELVPTRERGEPVRILQHHSPTSEAIYLAHRVAELHAGGTAWRQIAVLVRTQDQRAALAELPCEVMTIHAAKGLEFEHVFICGANDGLMPLGGDLAEEQRLFFVALTRARETLEISWYTAPEQPRFHPRPSPFLRMMPPNLVNWERPRTTNEQSAATAWKTGQMVRHRRYGVGELIAVDGDSLVVQFPGWGEKRFSAGLSSLAVLENDPAVVSLRALSVMGAEHDTPR